MAFVTGDELSLLICQALGIDPECVTRLVLTCEPGAVATLEVTRAVRGGQALAEVLAANPPVVVEIAE